MDGRSLTRFSSVGALSLTRIRELLAHHVALRQAQGDDQLHLVHGPDLFGPLDTDHLPDGLHPDPAGYQLMATRFQAAAFVDGDPFG